MIPKIHIPTFTYCRDGKWYEDLIYQDSPLSRQWFICFDADEPAEVVVREATHAAGGFGPLDILRRRGFADCVQGVFNGRKTPRRFFGAEADGKPIEGHDAISWFIVFKKGVPLPTPGALDSCAEVWSIFPNKPGVYFGGRV